MADISKCDGKDCPKKETCYRFTAPSSKYRQSYIMPKERGDKCKMYWKIKPNGGEG